MIKIILNLEDGDSISKISRSMTYSHANKLVRVLFEDKLIDITRKNKKTYSLRWTEKGRDVRFLVMQLLSYKEFDENQYTRSATALSTQEKRIGASLSQSATALSGHKTYEEQKTTIIFGGK